MNVFHHVGFFLLSWVESSEARVDNTEFDTCVKDIQIFYLGEWENLLFFQNIMCS
jgi:virulence-associated protein VapD